MLTVEDDPIVRADLRLILEDAGFDVSDARDGLEAIELARTERPDLILIDLGLPNVDGVEATRRILRERRVPVVALTGHRTGGLVERALEAGAVAHVLKPFHAAKLVGTITSAISRHEGDDFGRRALVESMVRQNYSEREIAAAVGGYAWDSDLAVVASLFRRLIELVRR